MTVKKKKYHGKGLAQSVILAIANNKGGVGKTATTINLGHALAKMGLRVLIVDMDEQCCTTDNLTHAEVPSTLYELLTESATPAECIVPTSCCEGVELLPSVPELSGLFLDLVAREDRGYPLLYKHLRPYALENYDVTLLDCPPNFGVYTIMAVLAADGIISPVESGSIRASKGLNSMFTLTDDLLSQTKRTHVLRRVLFTQIDHRTKLSKAHHASLEKQLGNIVFSTSINRTEAIKAAEAVRQTVLEYDHRSRGARQYRELANELAYTLQK